MQRQQMQQMQPMRFQPGASVHTGGQAFSSPAGETVLVIIDMQTEFKEASQKELVANVCNLIDTAIARNWTIVELVCVGYGETLEPIRKKLENYAHKVTVKKHGNNGAYPILVRLNELQVRPKRYVVCGVSVNACVRETTCDLAFSNGHPLTDVITSACGDHYAPRWDEYPEASHLRLLPEL